MVCIYACNLTLHSIITIWASPGLANVTDETLVKAQEYKNALYARREGEQPLEYQYSMLIQPLI